ncbi:hypothetical protein Tco_0961043, partial [Tanacetum coccineum]
DLSGDSCMLPLSNPASKPEVIVVAPSVPTLTPVLVASSSGSAQPSRRPKAKL